jgi:DnaJ-class molecular chaperone
MPKSHYEILGVSDTAESSEIKKAFRSLSMKYHPDRNPNNPDAEKKMQEINNAYDTLSDTNKRNQYDMELKFGVMGNGGGMPDDFADINNIFNMMFGGGMPGMPGSMGGPNVRVFHTSSSSGMRGGGNNPFHSFFRHVEKPTPILKEIYITMEQMYHGVTLPMEIERVVVHNNIQSTEIASIQVKIPAGIKEDSVLLFENKGHNINNESHGDIKFIIKLNNTTLFVREEMDIIYKKTITLKEALCGFSFEIKHLNDKLLCINNRTNHTVIKPNYKKVIPNLGFANDNTTGNLIIEFSIEFPDYLSENQISKISDIL